ncbi:hypothetical protein [Fictibacillus phosphorivorans]|uniref:hypothetical protein n=1 Tax=Fictibacillus phosphorivorans TaxID=1221500 RepID=UPI00203AA6D1|nr:hypothetical protein [Fictibacillus phosphorivorans]MCM3718057.1 hypothetical protein [Fictibacillus phosphorivorans]MCM3775684.1 hypothetical protein [Fictibacillus phosphorivorans]
MEINMSPEEVLSEIQGLMAKGSNLNKKQVKKTNPQLMRNALHYFPSWDDAIERSNTG